MKRLLLLSLIPASACLAACQPVVPLESDAAAPSGRAFAQQACGSCHAVEAYRSSANRDAPTFAAIANQPGLTRETLAAWLRDAHNYPGEMQFTLEPGQVEALVDYMLTLQDPDYRPSI